MKGVLPTPSHGPTGAATSRRHLAIAPIGLASRPLKTALLLAVVSLQVAAQTKPSLLHTAPEQASPNEPLRVDGNLVNGGSIERVVIRYRGPGDEYADVRMELQYGDLYRGFIPAERMVPPGVEYYVEGVTSDGRRIPLFASAGKPARVLVIGDLPARDLPHKRTPEPQPPPKPPSDDERRRRFEEPSPRNAGPSELEQELALYSAEDTVALATRHEEKVTKVPAIASSIDRELISAVGARSVFDVLDVVPGLSVSRDVQGFHRVAVRGLRSDPEVLFLLDGHRLDNFFDGRALANLPIENIERIEVIRGPGSAVHGAGAFLGVVNIITDRSEGVRAAASGGMNETVDAHVGGAKSFGGVKLFADADFLDQAGYQKPIAKDSLERETLLQRLRLDPLEPAGKTNDRRRFVSVGGGGSAVLGDGSLSLTARYLTEGRGALVGLFDAVGRDSYLKWQVLLADAQYERRIGDASTFRVRGFFDEQWTNRLFQLTPRGFRTTAGDEFPEGLLERTEVRVRTLGADASTDIQLAENNRLSFGAVAEQQALLRYAYETNYTAENRYTGPVPVRPTLPDGSPLPYPQDYANGAAASRLTLGLYAQDQWTVIERLTLTFGFRLDARSLPVVGADGRITGAALVPSLNPRFGAVFSASDALVFKVLYGRAFRSPTVQELTESIPNTDYNQGRFEGNPDLDPAVVDAFEIGADLVQVSGEARVRLRANGFYESFTNPIAAVDTSGNVVPLHNRQGVRVFGLEGEARLEASKRANAWVNASWFRAEDVGPPSHLKLLTDTPQARFNAGLSLPLGDYLSFDVVVRVGAERRNNSRTVLELIRRWRIPTYALVTAQLRTEPLADHFELALVGHNLFDHDHVDDVPRADRITALLPREGVAVFATVRARY